MTCFRHGASCCEQELEKLPHGLGDPSTRKIMWQLVKATEHLHASGVRLPAQSAIFSQLTLVPKTMREKHSRPAVASKLFLIIETRKTGHDMRQARSADSAPGHQAGEHAAVCKWPPEALRFWLCPLYFSSSNALRHVRLCCHPLV